jgi:hypothetical protein
MPEKTDFWNPYRFVPVRSKPPSGLEKKKAQSHEREHGTYYRLKCRLETLSPLFVGGGGSHNAMLGTSRRPLIPGTSLKGMLRSLSELVSGGCAAGLDGERRGGASGCSPGRAMCAPCRIFGAMEKSALYLGRINIGDAVYVGEKRPDYVSLAWLAGSPKTSHRAFYKRSKAGQRKLYFHQNEVTEKLKPSKTAKESGNLSRKQVKAISSGAVFDFEVRLEGLSKAELGLILYCLALEGDKRHRVQLKPRKEEPVTLNGSMRQKIGQGKGAGLGSIKISIIEIGSTGLSRLNTLRSNWGRMRGGELKQFIDKRTAFLTSDDSDAMTQLRKMMVFDSGDKRFIEYPSYHWFRDNSQVPLREI